MDDEMFAPSTPAESDAPEGPLAFDCPRCGRAAHAQYWGPCANCREELVVTQRREGRQIDEVAYEPKMNVVPNQVATKE